VVWSGSERAILLWCAYSGAYLGALISTESELPVDSDQALSAAAEAEDRKHMVDPAKVSAIIAYSTWCYIEVARNLHAPLNILMWAQAISLQPLTQKILFAGPGGVQCRARAGEAPQAGAGAVGGGADWVGGLF
jgi:hypothetical protein